jgi:hypothetical protein
MLDVPARDFAPLIKEMRAVGKARLPDNATYFTHIAEEAERLAAEGRDDEACVQISIAAFHASARHSGLWVSRRLEALLPHAGYTTRPAAAGRPPSTM